jgi:transcriptional regulator with XRE-family HTH domain
MSAMNRRHGAESAYSAISTRIVRHLHDQGMTLKEIGALMGLKEAFISRVRNGQRSLTLEHLTRLEDALGKSLPAILVDATPLDAVPKKLRPMYKAFNDFLATL